MNMKRNRGLSLVELMVALVLSAVIIGGIFQVFMSNRQAFNLTESLVRIQENGRFALSYISAAIRQSGSYGCVPDPDPVIGNVQNRIAALTSIDAIHPTDTFDGAAIAGSFDAPDELRLLQLTENTALVNSATTVAGQLNVFAGGDFNEGDFILVSNCEVGDFMVAGAGTTDLAILDTGLDIREGPYVQLNKVSHATEVRSIRFFVEDEFLKVQIGTGAEQELLDGIENIQFTYGVDTDASQDYTPDYFDRFSDIPASERERIVAIRVSVLAVSTLAAIADVTTEPKEITFNGTTLTINDRRLRKVFETTVSLRNRMN